MHGRPIQFLTEKLRSFHLNDFKFQLKTYQWVFREDCTIANMTRCFQIWTSNLPRRIFLASILRQNHSNGNMTQRILNFPVPTTTYPPVWDQVPVGIPYREASKGNFASRSEQSLESLYPRVHNDQRRSLAPARTVGKKRPRKNDLIYERCSIVSSNKVFT